MNPCRTLSPPISRSHSQTLHFPCASPEVNGQTGPPGCDHIHPDCPTGDYRPTELHPRSLTLPNVCLPTSYLASLPVTRRNLSHIKSQPCSLYTTHCVLPASASELKVNLSLLSYHLQRSPSFFGLAFAVSFPGASSSLHYRLLEASVRTTPGRSTPALRYTYSFSTYNTLCQSYLITLISSSIIISIIFNQPFTHVYIVVYSAMKS